MRTLTIPLLIVLAAIACTLLVMALRLNRKNPDIRVTASAGLSTLLLGLVALLGTIQPSSDVLLGTQILFGCAALWFAFLEWRLMKRR